MGSSRLPGKMLHAIEGDPLLIRTMQRVEACKLVDELMVATSNQDSDQPIVDIASRYGFKCFVGDGDDVLDRYYQAARSVNAQVVVRITGDCPLIDPELVDEVIAFYLGHSDAYDYVHNGESFPEGIVETEVFSFRILKQAWKRSVLASDREHVTAFINKHPELFRIYTLEQEPNLGHIRLTVDEQSDVRMIERLLPLLPKGRISHQRDVLEVLAEHEEILQENMHIKRNAGYEISLRNDRLQKDSEADND